MANIFDENTSNFFIKDFNFLPSFRIDLLDGSDVDRNEIALDPEIDIWDGKIN